MACAMTDPLGPHPMRMNRSRLLGYVTAACSLALLAPLLLPLLTGRVFVNTDLQWFHLPTRHLYQQALMSGDSVLWTPSIFSGLYIHGEGQVGLFHPFHQLLYRLLPLGVAFNFELVANYLMAFGGTFWFMRRLRFGHVPALFGAMLFAFSGFNLLHHQHLNMVAVVAHMPWLLGVTDILIVDDRRRARALALAAVALILGSELLIGFPQGVWWNAVAFAAFGVFRAWETGRWRRLAQCASGAALGVLLGAIQVVPTLDAAAQSTRVERTADFALTYSLAPSNLIQLWSPYFFRGGASGGEGRFHEYGLYSGAILAVALAWVWVRRPALPRRRGLIAAATAFAALGFILALGRYGGIGFLLAHLPVLQSLRAPARHIVLVQFALVILAAVALEDLLEIAEGRSSAPSGPAPALWIPAALGVVTTIALNSGLLPFGKHTFEGAARAAPGAALVAAVTLLVYLAGRRRGWALPAVVVVTTLDLAMWGTLYVYRDPAQRIEELAARAPLAPAEPAESYAFAARYSPYFSDVLILKGYRLTSGYAGLFPASRHPLEGESVRGLSGTRWLFPPSGVRRPFQGAVDRVRLLDEQGQSTAGSVRMAVDRPGRLVADIDAPGRRIVAFTERFHAGWSATINGTRLQTVRVEGDFLGCLVDDGVHRATLQFMPRSFMYGSALTAIGVALVVGVLFLGLK
jgi:hypothetical protein